MKDVTMELLLEDLCCANCAGKIEAKVKELPGIKSASLNFVYKKLKLEIEKPNEFDFIYNQIKDIVSHIEPDVKVSIVENKAEAAFEDEDHKPEIIRLVIGAVFFFIPFLFKITGMYKFILYFISYLIVGGDVLILALKNILNGHIFDENFLMTIATIGAFSIGEYPEGAAVMLFYSVGELFQDIAVNRSRKSITALLDIRPDFANLKSGDEIKKVSPVEVKKGDIIIVKPGEKIPLDGIIIDGSSMVDTTCITGESVPRSLKVGDEALSGFISQTGLLTIKVVNGFSESTVSKILDLVENASSKKAATENFITKFARYYTPAVVLTAALLAVVPPLLIKDALFSTWIYRALVFLVISCPCALVISIPLGFFAGLGASSKKGILVKGSNYLEALNNVEIAVFDKTGTLTKGTFNVTDINPVDMSKNELLKYAAYAETFSNHPIAISILNSYSDKIDKDLIESYIEMPGFGVKAHIPEKEILAGNSELMKKSGIKYLETSVPGTVIHIAVNKVYSGFIVISDEIKEDSASAIKALKELGVKKTVMLTGDRYEIAEKIANTLEIDEFYAELLPDEKVSMVEKLNDKKSASGKLIFTGDGINDSPVLAISDIGISMGGVGSDAAIEASDIVIMTDELSKLPDAIKIAKKTRKIVLENIIFTLSVKVVVLALGALGMAEMWQAVFADVGVALIAVLNSMRGLK